MRNQSDSEDDEEYVPPTGEQLSSDSETEPQADPPQSKARPTTTEELEKKSERDTAWAKFQASVASSSKNTPDEVGKKMVKVQKKYLFAGQYITEIVEVPKDSLDAKKWPLYQGDTTDREIPQPDAHSLPQPSMTAPASTDSSESPKPPPKKPGPRKSKTVLGALPSSSTQKAKKLSTLDKSLMDWQSHTMDTSLQDELEANRKGGGYLEKVEFLKRVDERKEENMESLKSRKRRKL
ncbi:SWR1-complex protein 5 [Leucoagaricus sp. SymC.cos]|nr:SWR1-complex protein 5 [Leucoagaricus sp. SymC.cos]